MRLASLRMDGRDFIGARRHDGYVDLNLALPELAARDVTELLRRGFDEGALAAARDAATTALDPASVRYRPLLDAASRVVCLGLNYVMHAAEAAFEKPSYPVIFGRYPSSFVGHGEPLIRPKVSHHFDYEAELVAVIGKRARHVSKERALEVVAGYSLLNDGSVRDYQNKTHQWTLGKNFDDSGSIGPELVTADELPPGARGLRIEGRLDGEVLQAASTSEMIFDVETVVAILSEAMELQPGDVIAMGTPAGVGVARTPRVYLEPGKVFEVEIERIGVLRNGIVDEG